jgi:hypothetical protein
MVESECRERLGERNETTGPQGIAHRGGAVHRPLEECADRDGKILLRGCRYTHHLLECGAPTAIAALHAHTQHVRSSGKI